MSLSLGLIPLAFGVTTAISYALEEKVEGGTFYRIDTNMKEEAILEQALKNFGSDVVSDEETFQMALGDLELAFQKQENGTLSAIFNENVATDDATEFLEGVQQEYARMVQKQTYEKLLERAKNEGLQLETETTNEDDSIVLTFEVEENWNYE